MNHKPSLNDYVESAAAEFWQETGKRELEPLWIAEYYQDGGVMDDHPRISVTAFFDLVQKMLDQNLERAAKLERLKQDKASHADKPPLK